MNSYLYPRYIYKVQKGVVGMIRKCQDEEGKINHAFSEPNTDVHNYRQVP